MFAPSNSRIELNVERWTTAKVDQWIAGLDDCLSQYRALFVQAKITGKQLLMIEHTDLQRLGITKIGHQEGILEAIESTKNLCHDVDSKHLQKLALICTCRSRHLMTALNKNRSKDPQDIKLLSSVSYFVLAIREITQWLQQAPFSTLEDYISLKQQLLQAALYIVNVLSSKSRSALADRQEHVLAKLNEIMSKCQDVVENCNDPFVVMTMYLESVTIRKRADEPLGLQFVTNNGIHKIRKIRENTACSNSTKLSEGDEIVQVNNQTVLGWQLKHVVNSLKEKPKEVVLCVKKHPRHWQPPTHHRKPPAVMLGDDLKQSTFPKRSSKYSTEDLVSGRKTSTTESPPSSVSADSPFQDKVLSPVEGAVFETDRGQTVSGAGTKAQSRPTILITDIFKENTVASGLAGKREILSSFHVVKSTPELRSPVTEELPPPPSITLTSVSQDVASSQSMSSLDSQT